jgi:hypothetical protein
VTYTTDDSGERKRGFKSKFFMNSKLSRLPGVVLDASELHACKHARTACLQPCIATTQLGRLAGLCMHLASVSCMLLHVTGRETSANDVKSTVAKFNIQFDNLCQFLPQDKVVEFARMDAYELLVATEKALGDSKLYTTHMELIQDCKVVQDVQQVCFRGWHPHLYCRLARLSLAVYDTLCLVTTGSGAASVSYLWL